MISRSVQSRGFAAQIKDAKSLRDLFSIEGKKYEITKVNKIVNTLKITDWEVQEDTRVSFTRNFQFRDFKQSMIFLNSMAVFCDEIDHHPEWFNVYNKVNVLMSSHWCAGLSYKDLMTAQAMNFTFAKVVGLSEKQSVDFHTPIISSSEYFELFKPHLHEF